MHHFEYYDPATLTEALSLLSKYRDKAKVLAGGTDLLVAIKGKTIRPQCVISLRRIAGLNQSHFAKQGNLQMGALTTIHDIEHSPELRGRYGVIYEAARQLASFSVRNVATVGGNLCNAAPSADMAPALIALSAVAKLVSAAEERIIPLEDFFTGPGTTVLKTDELLVDIQVPVPPAHTAGAYLKLGAKGVESLAVVGVAVVLTLNSEGDVCNDARVVLGAVAPTPMRARNAEGMLKGKRIDEALIERVAQAASDESRPINDVRSPAEYRKELVKVITKQAIRRAAELAKAAI